MTITQSSTLLLAQRMFDTSPDFISVVDTHYCYQRVNAAYARAFGIDLEHIVGMHARDLFGEETFDETFKPKVDQCLRGNDVQCESWVIFPKLGRRYMSVNYFPLRSEDSLVEGVIVVARDVTDLKQAQDQLLERSEDRYRDLFDAAPLAYFSALDDGQIQIVNVSAVSLLGYSKEELIGKSILDLYARTMHGREKAMRLQEQAQHGIGVEGEELQLLRKNGSTVWVSLTLRLIYDHQGQVIEHRGVLQDISERKNKEEELVNNQRRLQLINEILLHVSNGMTLKEIVTQIIQSLSVLYPAYRIAYSRITDRGELEVLNSSGPIDMPSLEGLKVNLNTAPGYLARLRSHQSVCISDVTQDPIVAPVLDVMLSAHTRAICDVPLVHLDELQGLLCLDVPYPHEWTAFETHTLREVAELMALMIHNTRFDKSRREVEAALGASEACLQSILDYSPTLIYMKDREGRYLLINKKCEEMLGVTNEQIRGKTTAETLPQKLAEQFLCNDQMIIESGQPRLCEEQISQADGEHTVLSMQFPIFDSDGKLHAFGGISTDITERKRIEAALRKSESHFQKYFKSGLVGMAICSVGKGWIEVNDRLCEILGYSQEKLKETTWDKLTHPDDLEFNEAKFSQLLAGGIESYCIEKRYIRPDGNIVHANLYVNAVHDDTGTVEYAMTMVEDITDRKQAEQRLIEAQKALQDQNDELEQEIERRSLRIHELEQRRMHVEKLAALAQVAAGVAHEINNPLASISQAMLLIKDAIDPAHPDVEYIGRIDECVSRMARIVRHMYDLYRPHQSTMSQQNIVPIVSTAVDIMQSVASERQVYIGKSFSIHEIMVSCESSELVQVICNLLQNSLDASASGQRVMVNIATQENGVTISVADQGTGIASGVEAHIFEPFFTTKASKDGQGLGLGLSVSRSLIESMGGALDFTSNEKHGSIFTVSLPVT